MKGLLVIGDGESSIAVVHVSLRESDRIANQSKILAEATDRSGRSFRASLSTPDAYDFTAHSVLEIASRIAARLNAMGLVTPFQAFGADFVLSLPGCSRRDIPSS